MKKIICFLLVSIMLLSSFLIPVAAYDYQTTAFWNVELLGNHTPYIGTTVKEVSCYVRVNGTKTSTDSIYMYIKNHVVFSDQPTLTREKSNTYIPGTSSGNAAYANAAIGDWGTGATYSRSYSAFYFENLTLGIKQNTSYMY